MKRLILGAAVVAFLATISFSHLVWATPAPKVTLCHVDTDRPHVISVSENALPAHLAHGDCMLTSGIPGEDCTCP